MRKIFVAVLLVFGVMVAAPAAFGDDALVAGDSPATGSEASETSESSATTAPAEPAPAPVPAWKLAADGKTWNYFTDSNDPATQVRGQWVTTSDGPAIAGLPAGEHRYWLDADGALAVKRVIDPDKAVDSAAGFAAYATKFGFPATGKTIVGKKVYLAKATGELESGNKHGILTTRAYDSKKRVYYIDPSTHSAVITKKPVKVKGFGWVFARSQAGYLMTGRTVVGNKVYLARENGKLETGDKRGFLSTKRYDGKESRLYFINKQTHAITYGKPALVSKSWGYVYAPNKKGYLLRGLTRIDKKHVLLVEKNGRICNDKGWVETSRYAGTSQRYRLEATSKNPKVRGAVTGLFEVNGRRYLANDDGTIVRSTWQQLGNSIYHVSSSGAMEYDAVTSRMRSLAQGYSSPSRYLLMVDIDNPRVMVFEGSRGNWGVKFIWDCCTGAPETPTITGTFHVGAKGYSFGEGSGYSCYYWTQISGDYLFHTRLYYPYTHTILNGAMGKRVSHGCVRLMDESAIWIQRNVPAGTTVACIR